MSAAGRWLRGIGILMVPRHDVPVVLHISDTISQNSKQGLPNTAAPASIFFHFNFRKTNEDEKCEGSHAGHSIIKLQNFTCLFCCFRYFNCCEYKNTLL